MIRVLIVDDSVVARNVIGEALGGDAEITVVDNAASGEEAILKVMELKPDVITLDIQMPEVDGLTALEYIMAERPTPVVIVSGMAGHNSRAAASALELGAVAVVAKPAAGEAPELWQQRLLAQVRQAARCNVRRTRALFERAADPVPSQAVFAEYNAIVAIGASTGGPKAIQEIVPYVASNIGAAILIVQHMPAMFTRSFAQRLQANTKIPVREAQDGEMLQSGRAYVAPGDSHLVVRRNNGLQLVLTRELPVHHVRPSYTVLLESLAAAGVSNRVIGVVLTGMGSDGIEGLTLIKQKGGRILAQSPETCVVFGMPRAAIEAGVVDQVVPLSHMGMEIVKSLSRVKGP